MGPLGVQELIFIFVIALIVFGPRKLPSLGKSLGKSIAEFKRASNELKSTLESEVKLEETRREIMEPIESVARQAESVVREHVSATMAEVESEADAEAKDAVEAATIDIASSESDTGETANTADSHETSNETSVDAEKVSATVSETNRDSDVEPN